MNDKFYTLSKERQQNMVNAGYRVFATYPYKKAPMSSIADAAGISKSLLFHYCENKKGLYLYLLDLALKTSAGQTDKEGLAGETDFFLYLKKNLCREIRLMSVYPCLFHFLRAAYFETDPEVNAEIEKLKAVHMDTSTEDMLRRIDRSKFKDPTAPETLLELITLAVEGYMTFQSQSVFHDPKSTTERIEYMINSLRDNYYR